MKTLWLIIFTVLLITGCGKPAKLDLGENLDIYALIETESLEEPTLIYDFNGETFQKEITDDYIDQVTWSKKYGFIVAKYFFNPEYKTVIKIIDIQKEIKFPDGNPINFLHYADNDTLYYSILKPSSEVPFQSEIYSYNLKNNEKKQLVNFTKGNIFYFFPSPDNCKIAFVCVEGPIIKMCYVDCNNGNIQQLKLTSEQSSVYDISWLPDSNNFLFTTFKKEMWHSEDTILKRINIKTNEKRKIDIKSLSPHKLTSSPDGKLISFSTTTNQGRSLYIYDLEKEKVIKKINPNLDCHDPQWSPDGKYISFIGFTHSFYKSPFRRKWDTLLRKFNLKSKTPIIPPVKTYLCVYEVKSGRIYYIKKAKNIKSHDWYQKKSK